MSTYDRRWQRARARVLKHAQACWLCGGALDFNAAARSPLSPSVDHIFPLKAMRSIDPETRERLRLDPENLRPVHYRCNAKRGAGRPRRAHVSRAWS